MELIIAYIRNYQIKPKPLRVKSEIVLPEIKSIIPNKKVILFREKSSQNLFNKTVSKLDL